MRNNEETTLVMMTMTKIFISLDLLWTTLLCNSQSPSLVSYAWHQSWYGINWHLTGQLWENLVGFEVEPGRSHELHQNLHFLREKGAGSSNQPLSFNNFSIKSVIHIITSTLLCYISLPLSCKTYDGQKYPMSNNRDHLVGRSTK